MELLDALVKAAEGKDIHVRSMTTGEVARTVVFVFMEDGSNAFISEVAEDELVPLLEKWCGDKRAAMGRVM